MKVGIIGTGSMGSVHCRVCNELGVLDSVYDQNMEQAKIISEKYRVHYALNLGDLLCREPDAVIIATPTPTHKDIALACMKAGINILLEKPMCKNLSDAQSLVETAKNAGILFTVGYIERYNPVVRELLNRVYGGLFGEITSVNIKRVGGIPRTADNVITDIMTHDLNILLELFGHQPNQIYVHKREQGNTVHSAQVLLDFGRASATCEGNWVSPIKIRTIAITGTKGYAELDLIKQEMTQFYKSSRWIDDFKEEPLKNEIEAFLHAIKNNTIVGIVTPQNALDTLALTLEAAYGV